MEKHLLEIIDSLNNANKALTEEAAAARKDALIAQKEIANNAENSNRYYQAIAYLCITGQIFNFREWAANNKMAKEDFLKIITGYASLI